MSAGFDCMESGRRETIWGKGGEMSNGQCERVGVGVLWRLWR